jgi:hypothetical protein
MLGNRAIRLIQYEPNHFFALMMDHETLSLDIGFCASAPAL